MSDVIDETMLALFIYLFSDSYLFHPSSPSYSSLTFLLLLLFLFLYILVILQGSAYNTPCPAGFYCQSPTVQTRCQVRGSYCPAGSFEQGTCPPGSFCPSSSVLKECTLGSYCPAATVEDQSCPAGYYCSSDTKTIQPCPRGFRCPARSISPVICTVQPGFYCPAATGDYVSCPEGFFCPNSTDEPRPCSPGYSCPFGSTAQRPCRGGFYCPKSGAEVVCPSGYYCPNGSSEPVVCGRGYYCQRQSAGPSRCTSGYIAPSETTDVCTPCEPGMFEESRLKCSPCPFGSYTSSSRSSSCNTCASGETTVPFGGTSSRQCVPASPFNGSSAVLLLTIILPIGLIGLPLFLICAYNICSKRSWIEYDGYGIAYQVKDILSLDIGGVDSAERAGFLQFIDSIVLTMNIKLANNGSSHANGILSPNVKDISSASAYMTISEMPSYQRQVYAHAIAESMSARCIKGRCCGRTSGRGDSNLILPRTLSVSGYFVFSKYQFMYRVWQDNVDAIAADAVQRLDSARGLVNDGGDNDAVPAVVVNTSNATGASTSTASSSIVSPGRAEVGKLPLLGSDAGYSGYSGV